MKITIFTHPNNKINHLSLIVEAIRKNANVYVDISYDWKNIENIENINDLKIYALSDPFETIHQCVETDKTDSLENEKVFRWKTIKEKTNYDLSEYSSLEAACLSYLMWIEIAQDSGLDFVFKIEQPDDIFKYLKEKGVIGNIKGFKYAVFTSFKQTKSLPYKDVSFGTLNLLGRYCEKYNYKNYLKALK